ncbi:hypothetical protein EYY98_10570 [Obesumbacterium proteus]|nr:hypothetical protein EYY98_10570 [Obesumbacterium proteus]
MLFNRFLVLRPRLHYWLCPWKRLKPPPPPASLMQSAPDMMQSLNAIISVSSNESDNPKQ